MAVSALTAVALIGVAVAGLRTLERDVTTPIPIDDPYASGRYPIFERTATIENFTVTSLSNWYLVNQWPLTQPLVQLSETTTPGTIPIFRLSNRDPGLDLPICNVGGSASPLGGDAAVLQVSVDFVVRADGTLNDFPPTLEEGSEVRDGACGEGRYGHFTVAGVPYIVWIGLGPEASAEDRAQVFEAFSSMEIDGRPQDPQTETAAYVIAGGENAAGPWTLELSRSRTDGPAGNVELRLLHPRKFVVEGVGGTGDFTVPDVSIEQAGGDPTFGAVTKEATGVELRPQDGGPAVPATLVPLPPSMPFDFDLFFAPYEADVPATAVPLGLPEPSPQDSPTSTPTGSNDDVVTIEGTDPHWTLSLSGTDQDPCIDFDTRGDNFETLCPGPLSLANDAFVRIWSDSGQLFAVAVAPAGLSKVRFEGSNGSTSQGVCTSGPSGWQHEVGCVIPLLDLEDGSFVFSSDAVCEPNCGGLEMTWPMDRSRQLPWSNDGNAITATGVAGTWRVELVPDQLRTEVGGRIQTFGNPALDDPIVLSHPDRPYDALLLVLTETSVDQIDVTSEGRWYGRWMPSQTKDGDDARLWIVELPGMGGGGLSYDGGRSVPISWP